MGYEAVIGLEVHAQLLTESKLFCRCSTRFGSEPNTQVCPVCLGMPGSLPVLNARAVEYALRMALAVGCRINPASVFARKNYFYPDLPKGYQISQYEQPLAEAGHVEIEAEGGGLKKVGITRIHMEEDAGKLLHGEAAGSDTSSFVDLNRTGVPLIEIVSEPDISSPAEAAAYLKELRDILVYLEICDGNMEEGSFRCDANVSVRPEGSAGLGTKTELKNLNSFKFIKDAVAYEIERQIEVIEDGGRVVQETRLFDVSRGVTVSMRSKEQAHDYRYFPDPDLLPLAVGDAMVDEVRSSLPELPADKRRRFVEQYSLPAYDASVLASQRQLADWYEACVKLCGEPKLASNWVMGELLRLLKEENLSITDAPATPRMLAELIGLVKNGTISGKIAKGVFEEAFRTGRSPKAIVESRGLTQISDEADLERIVDEAVKADPESAARYRAGKTKLLGYFVGQVMKATRGRANPQVVNRLVKRRLEED
ncbi:MAG TPA: Asp-tRNA(Asn)/Glu-tRNA(Gln) amidotransferase subunit GatB [Deltaproteobacteria bacterium]|nr:Asp-tRNA(Asn)/Glu-tRNA(Gln) amidotransferase subunit GatB [Deltaproteobacteria bacterium]